MPFNRKDHHNFGEIRPRFRLRTTLSEEEVYERLIAHVEEDNTVVGKRVYSQYYLDIPHSHRHFWSPELRLSAEKDEFADHDDTIIRVNIGPQYTVWVMFVFMYTILGVICLFGGMYGLTQLSMGKESLWVWCFPVIGAMILGLYVISKSGQKATRDHTLHLVSVLYHALGQDNVERIDS